METDTLNTQTQKRPRSVLRTPAPGPNRQWRSAIRYLIISCAQCQEEFKTDRKRKYCAPKCREKANKAKRPDRHKNDPWHEKTCLYCEFEFKTQDNRSRYCSKSCHGRHVSGRNRSTEVVLYDPHRDDAIQEIRRLITLISRTQAMADRRSDIRKAYESGDMPGLLAAIRDRCSTNDAGCWIWGGTIKKGYGRVNFGSKNHSTHRLAALARYGIPESEPVVHHRCAITECCNPDHLQPVSQRDNIAEMLERNYYLKRIAELEAEVMKLDPTNPKLSGYELSA